MIDHNKGEYTEDFFGGGKLVVTVKGWHIRYYFPGFDRRHKGKLVYIWSQSVLAEAQALLENWDELERLQATIPKGCHYSVAGKGSMKILISDHKSGICLEGYHVIASSREQAFNLSNAYLAAPERAEKIQCMLRAL